MKKFVGVLAALIAGLFCFQAPARAYDSFTVLDSTSMAVSTFTATKIVTGTNYAAGFVILYAPATPGYSQEFIAIGSDSSVSTTTNGGYFRFPVGSPFTLYDYKGPVWAVAIGSAPINVSVLRKR